MRKQVSFNLNKGSRGGRRDNSGRKRTINKGCDHSSREKINSLAALHITIKYDSDIRCKHSLQLLIKGLTRSEKAGLRIIYYTLQLNHVHLIAEAKSNAQLEKGMRIITGILSKNATSARQLSRYHLHRLKSKQEASNAHHYVMGNELKHSGKSSTKWSGKFLPAESWLLKASLKLLP